MRIVGFSFHFKKVNLFFVSENLKNICTDEEVFEPESSFRNDGYTCINALPCFGKRFFIPKGFDSHAGSLGIIAEIIFCQFPNLKSAFSQIF